MVDIHCHILPGLDDGPDSLDESLKMAEMAIEDGITHVVGTPHANDEFKFSPELVRERRDELQRLVGDRLQLATGCDFHLSFENLQDIHQNPQKYTIHQKQYLLVELADFAIPPTMDDTLHHLQLEGLSPIITHPERNGLIRAKPERLYRWLHQGCFVQITAGSLLGRFGEHTMRLVEKWLAEDRVHFFASDAHNLSGRPLALEGSLREDGRHCGEKESPKRYSRIIRSRPTKDGPCRTSPSSRIPPRAAAAPRKRFFFF